MERFLEVCHLLVMEILKQRDAEVAFKVQILVITCFSFVVKQTSFN